MEKVKSFLGLSLYFIFVLALLVGFIYSADAEGDEGVHNYAITHQKLIDVVGEDWFYNKYNAEPISSRSSLVFDIDGGSVYSLIVVQKMSPQSYIDGTQSRESVGVYWISINDEDAAKNKVEVKLTKYTEE